MGRYVVDLRDYQSVIKRLRVLTLAFSLPIENPNHMPVTRDLGAGDRKTILKWLATPGADGLPRLGTPEQSPEVAQPVADPLAAESAVELSPAQAAGKTAVILQIQQRAKAAAKRERDTK
jgi:hypothetical protein